MHSVNQSVDLHCHSTASDGELTPEQLLEKACDAGIDLLSITDHDTLQGARALLSRGFDRDITLVPGVEFSCRWRRQNLHVLAYAFAWEDEGISAFLAVQWQRRLDRARVIAERLERRLKLQDLYEKVVRRTDGGVPGRPHFAALLREEGVVASFAEAFDRYLGAGKIGDVNICWPDMSELMDVIRQAGALASLAHPTHYRMTATRLGELMDEFASLGGVGVEIAVPGIDSGHFGWLAEAARRRSLCQSFGSDYHGSRQPWRRLGTYPQPVRDLPSITDYFKGSPWQSK